ncbi:MAG: DUF309 domain-containing protein [Micromonosporaceae bacterium]
MNRDRDAAGRPRNARPRDRLGRPLPRGVTGEPGIPEGLAANPEATLEQAQRLIDVGRPFHAHEVLEERWKATTGAERDLWRGLAQIAVGLTHAQRGNERGAISLLRRGAGQIRLYGAALPHGLDPAAAVMGIEDLALRIERHGLDGVAPADLRPRLLMP